MLENIQIGDICIFQNGEEAAVTNWIKGYCGSRTIKLFFNKEVEGLNSKNYNWNYRIDGTWLGAGNNIVKVIHR